MAKIVINMPDYMLNQIMIGYPFKLPSQFVAETYKIIRNGKILPKGYGRIADVDKMLDEMRATRTYDILFALERVKPILEADKGGEEWK